MARNERRNRQLPKRTTQTKMTFLVEGPTEKYYFTELLKSLRYSDKIVIETVGGGGYISFQHYFQKNQDMIDICVIITDLDRAVDSHSEKQTLQRIITGIEKENPKSIFFLTNENIETWLDATLPDGKSFKNLKISKGDKDVFKKLASQGGSMNQAEYIFKLQKMYYHKNDFAKKGYILAEYIHLKQSNLALFQEFLQFHGKIEE